MTLQKKKIWRWVPLCLLLCLFPCTCPAAPMEQEEAASEEQIRQELETGVREVLDGLDLSELEELYADAADLLGTADVRQAIEALTQNGLPGLDPQMLGRVLWRSFAGSMAESWNGVLQILAIVVLSGVFVQLRQGMGGEAAFLAEQAARMLCCVLAAHLLAQSVAEVQQAAGHLARAVEVLSPVLMLLLTAMGSLNAQAVLSPLMTALTGGVFELIRLVVIPMILAKGLLDLGSGVSGMWRLDGFSKCIASAVKWLLGVLFVVFLGVTALKGIAGASIDGVYFKTAKFTIDKMVPIVGGMFSDTLETLVACSLIVKNAVGILGEVAIAARMSLPLLRLIAQSLLLRFAGAAAGLFGGKEAAGLLSGLSESVTLLFAALLSMSLMAFLFVAVVMGAADRGMMLW